MASKAATPVKKQAAKAPVKKQANPKPAAKPKETVTHPFGTCVPLGECNCHQKGNK